MESVEHFEFEDDFVEKNIRCIPMIVRFKMDKAGIKLKLKEWNKFSVEERKELAVKACSNEEEAKEYNNYLAGLIKDRTGNEATSLAVEQKPGWSNINLIPEVVIEKAKEFDVAISRKQWQDLSNLQRFTLIKLTRPGHESKNFVKAIKEFGLLTKVAI